MNATITAAAADLGGAYPLRPFRIRHDLAGHPLLQLPRIVELTRELDADRIEYNSGKLAPNQKPDETPLVDLPPEDVVRQIETAGAWMVLKRVDTVPAYRELLEEALGSIAKQLGYPSLKDAGFTDIEGFLFVSSPNSVTPFHVDPEDNFFVQIHGPKFFHILDNTDRTLVPEADLENAPTKHRNLRYEPSFESRASVYELEPGEGVFVPYQWPHWVRTGTTHSISMAITWKSPAVRRQNKLMFMNAMLRKFRLPQPRPGRVPMLDEAKVAAYSAARSLVEPLRRSESMRRRLRGLFFGKDANYYYRDEAGKKAA